MPGRSRPTSRLATLAWTTRPSLRGTSFISVSCAATACPGAVTTISCDDAGGRRRDLEPGQDGVLGAQLLGQPVALGGRVGELGQHLRAPLGLQPLEPALRLGQRRLRPRPAPPPPWPARPHRRCTAARPATTLRSGRGRASASSLTASRCCLSSSRLLRRRPTSAAAVRSSPRRVCTACVQRLLAAGVGGVARLRAAPAAPPPDPAAARQRRSTQHLAPVGLGFQPRHLDRRAAAAGPPARCARCARPRRRSVTRTAPAATARPRGHGSRPPGRRADG